MKALTYPFKAAIRLWQMVPKTPHCRFYPSCSNYCIQSLDKYGLFKGLAKCIFRIFRCHPFSKGGVDLP